MFKLCSSHFHCEAVSSRSNVTFHQQYNAHKEGLKKDESTLEMSLRGRSGIGRERGSKKQAEWRGMEEGGRAGAGGAAGGGRCGPRPMLR